jgi:hypothetical protein
MPADRLFHPRLGHSRKVSSLDHLQARVWKQYVLSADDFGVMPFTVVQIQADNIALAREPHAVIQSALEQLVAVGLVRTFNHQDARYLYQHDWQDWQKIEYPRVTIRPKPPTDLLKQCTVKTRKLFAKYPGGSPKHSPKSSRGVPEPSPTNARAHPRETANGKRQTANGRKGESEGERPFRPTPDEIKRARQWRQAVGRCPHTPSCRSSERCIGHQIRLWRKELEGVA